MQIIAYLMVCSWWVVRRWVCVYGYVFSFMLCSVFHQTAIYVPPFSAQSECSTFSFPAFPEMDSRDPIRSPQTPKMHPKLSAPKVMRQRYVCKVCTVQESKFRRPARVSSRQCAHRRTSLRAAASRERFQRQGNNYSKSQHPFVSSAARTKRDLQHGSVSHVLDLLAPVRLGCLLCKW